VSLRSNALTTVAQFNADTGNTVTADAERFIDAASQLIETYLNRGTLQRTSGNRSGWVLPADTPPAGTYTSLPADVQLAATMLASHLWHHRGKDAVAGTQQVGWGQAAPAPAAIPANITAILDMYRFRPI